jgi:hypothetical protein
MYVVSWNIQKSSRFENKRMNARNHEKKIIKNGRGRLVGGAVGGARYPPLLPGL